MTTYLKKWKMHENWGKSFFCPMDKKMISPNIEWFIGIFPQLCTIFVKTSTIYLKLCLITQLFILLGNFGFFSIFMPNLCSGGFNLYAILSVPMVDFQVYVFMKTWPHRWLGQRLGTYLGWYANTWTRFYQGPSWRSLVGSGGEGKSATWVIESAIYYRVLKMWPDY